MPNQQIRPKIRFERPLCKTRALPRFVPLQDQNCPMRILKDLVLVSCML